MSILRNYKYFNFKITTLMSYLEIQLLRVWKKTTVSTRKSIHSSLYHMLRIRSVSFTTWAPYSLKKILHSIFSSVFLDIRGSLDNKTYVLLVLVEVQPTDQKTIGSTGISLGNFLTQFKLAAISFSINILLVIFNLMSKYMLYMF